MGDQCTAFYVPRVYTSRVAQLWQPEPWAAQFTVVLCCLDTPSMEAKHTTMVSNISKLQCSPPHAYLQPVQPGQTQAARAAAMPCAGEPMHGIRCATCVQKTGCHSIQDFPAFDNVQCKEIIAGA